MCAKACGALLSSCLLPGQASHGIWHSVNLSRACHWRLFGCCACHTWLICGPVVSPCVRPWLANMQAVLVDSAAAATLMTPQLLAIVCCCTFLEQLASSLPRDHAAGLVRRNTESAANTGEHMGHATRNLQ
jgi:hypothetical protein